MDKTNREIYPIFDRMLARADKESLLRQHSVMIWFTGLSGSGKFRALGELIKENILFHYSINQRGRQTRLLLVFEMVKLRYVPIEGRMVLLFL